MQTNQRLGLILIVATLMVMVATAYLLFDYQQETREQMAQTQGLELVRLLGGMGWSELVPPNGQAGIFDLLARGQNNPDFAYGAVIDLAGVLSKEVTRPGVIVPPDDLSMEPFDWQGQRILQASNSAQAYLESYAPVFESGQHMGFVRLGYFKPDMRFSLYDLPFLATLLLPIFLLVPLFYFMLRQEIKPLKNISERFGELADQAGIHQVELQPSRALSDFMAQFSGYIEATQNKIQSLNQEHQDLMMSSKLLTYKNHRIDTILQNFPDAIMVIDEAGEVSYVNPAADLWRCQIEPAGQRRHGSGQARRSQRKIAAIQRIPVVYAE